MSTAPRGPAAAAADPPFTEADRRVLARHFTSVDGPVFALRDLPEATRAALFARYSRSGKSLRRLFLDEFRATTEGDGEEGRDGRGDAIGAGRARDLFARVLTEYGDDSVAQLAGAHVACEGISNLCTKAVEWGRFGAYLEQSTRYVAYTDRPGGRFRYHVPEEVEAGGLGVPYRRAMDRAFQSYGELLPALRRALDATVPAAPDPVARRRAIRAAALDAARGLLPVAATANVGIFASAQAFEALLLRLRVHRLAEARALGDAIQGALLPVIPDFLVRLDQPERGGAWTGYLARLEGDVARLAAEIPANAGPPAPPGGEPTVRLVRWDPAGERAVVAGALFPHARGPLSQVRAFVDGLTAEGLGQAVATVVGPRTNRRHRPGRGLEHTEYVFEIVCDYGAFRDLQRHRPATLVWQGLGPELGSQVPDLVEAAGHRATWDGAIGELEALHGLVRERCPDAAPYALALAHRVRWTLCCNAREAMHIIELRSQPQGHPEYRRVAQAMLAAIRDVAGHRHLAEAMRFADLEPPGPADIGRLAAELRLAGRQAHDRGPDGAADGLRPA
ncbi:MAG TPA: FAD-dependent thymidylate synthase [Candidatus Micrarchaeia archaeon]|nr:FAD-dependent thymidylate synthase [Candidatus Micrarchaeia archaeon]